MALWFELHVGTVRIGSFSARRIKGAIRPDALVTYAVEIHVGDNSWRGDVRHRREDGEFALIRRGLEAAGDLTKGVT